MRCSKCGAELSEDTKFCSYCGNKIEISLNQENISEEGSTSIPSDAYVGDFQKQKKEPKSLADKIKEKASVQWRRLSTYGKIATVAIVIFALLFIAALLSEKIIAIIIAIFQIALAIVAVLMHRGIIKIEQKQLWLKWLLLGIAVLFTVLNVMSYSWDFGFNNKPTSNVNTSMVAISVTTPYGATECLEQDYVAIKEAFSSAGFTNIVAEKVEDLQATEADKVNTIDVISVDGKTDFTQEQEFKSDDEVFIRYHGYAKCNVKIHVDFVPNLIFSKYDVNLLLNGTEEGTLTHGEDQDFEFSIDPGEYTLTFESSESSSVKGDIALNVDCDVEASYKISCSSDKVSIETLYVDRLTELADGEVKMDVAASEYKNQNYEDVTATLKTLGFTNIKYEVLNDIVLGWTDDGEVESVSIDGKTDFNHGDIFQADAEIIITYHMPEEENSSMSNESEAIQSDEADLNQKEGDETETNLTVENCPELASILTKKAEIDESYASFAATYSGKKIEFDGRIDYCTKNGNYNTRFDYLVSAGDYDPDHQIGPIFKFENVNYSDLHTDLDTVSVGLNVHIVAVVKSFDSNSGLFYLDPVSVTGR